MTKYYETKEFKLLQGKWYGKLADEGFVDIEDNIPWRLKGSSSMVSLNALKAEMDNPFDVHDIHEVLASDSDLLQFSHGKKAVYFQLAEQITAQGYRERLDPEMLEVWNRHSLGEGERPIADGLDLTRAKVRGYIQILRKTIAHELTAWK